MKAFETDQALLLKRNSELHDMVDSGKPALQPPLGTPRNQHGVDEGESSEGMESLVTTLVGEAVDKCREFYSLPPLPNNLEELEEDEGFDDGKAEERRYNIMGNTIAGRVKELLKLTGPIPRESLDKVVNLFARGYVDRKKNMQEWMMGLGEGSGSLEEKIEEESRKYEERKRKHLEDLRKALPAEARAKAGERWKVFAGG